MENQNTPAMEPILNLDLATTNLHEAFGLSESDYILCNHLISGIVQGQYPELGDNPKENEGISVNLEIPKVIMFIQSKCVTVEGFAMALYLFGNAMGQITANMNFVQAMEPGALPVAGKETTVSE